MGAGFSPDGVARAQRRGGVKARAAAVRRGFVISCISDNNSSEMDQDRLSRLTDKQRECLRLVYAHMSSKEIAQQLGVEPGTVDQYVKAAMRILGVSERRAAARMLAEHEEIGLAPPRGTSPPKPTAIREEQAEFRVTPVQSPKLPLPLWGSKPSGLSPLLRLSWMFVIMLVIALSFGAFLAGLEALSRLFTR